MKRLAILAGGALALSACTNDYVSVDTQMCVANTGIAMQADEATADLRPTQKAALIAQACGISVDAIVFKLAEAE